MGERNRNYDMTKNKRNIQRGKSIFQRELERTASRGIVVTILVGCLCFCIGILSINMLRQQINREKHLDNLSDTFYTIYESTEDFITDEKNIADFRLCMEDSHEQNTIRYSISKYNVDAMVGIDMIITDATGNICFSSFSEEDMNLHRQAFNRMAGENAKNDKNGVYTTVYYFSGDTSEYVMVKPVFQGERYLGNVSAYIKGSGISEYLTRYQYDTIVTNRNHDIIFCSNTSFLKERNANKYQMEEKQGYVYANNDRYLAEMRYLADKEIYLYSFIYAPRNYLYVGIGVGTILILGLFWTVLFMRILGIMAGKTSESVRRLVNEIRIIRKEDANHVIMIDTGDEIEEIGDQINKMVKSIHELNSKNVELVQINSQMEMQNLQAQMNPHFIYNTLDNIKYLIAPNPAKAEELIERFTHVLRYSINNTKRKVPLREDLTYIEDYLVIQQTRFGNRFAYEMDIDADCMEILIPKLLLQPLLENSIKYGFRKKTDIHVKVQGKYEGEYLILKVIDDGAGQPKSTLETLRGIIQTEEIDTTHNGLQNINRRIILEYGKESGMTLDSIDGEEFTVTLKLWIGESGENHVQRTFN